VTTIKLVEASFRENNLQVEVIANDDVAVEGFPQPVLADPAEYVDERKGFALSGRSRSQRS
jgi:hypothetical protein